MAFRVADRKGAALLSPLLTEDRSSQCLAGERAFERGPIRTPAARTTRRGFACLKRAVRNGHPGGIPSTIIAGMKTFGYARVSTDEQTISLQLDALRAAGCTEIFEDSAGGAQRDRPGLAGALAAAGAGDVQKLLGISDAAAPANGGAMRPASGHQAPGSSACATRLANRSSAPATDCAATSA